MAHLKDLSGRKFNKLTAIYLFPVLSHDGRIMWVCRCDCGKIAVVQSKRIISGHTKSCGCSLVVKPTHQMTGSIEYNSWQSMKTRCYNPTSDSYKYYGGRGVTVCQRWLNSFENFYADMGPRPSSEHTLDRINNDGNCEPSSCKWSTHLEQIHNRRVREECKNGHRLEGTNVLQSNGHRRCRECNLAWRRENRRR